MVNQMKHNSLTLGARLTLSFGALTVVLALMAWSALSTAGARDLAATKWITLLLMAFGLAIAAAAFGTARSAVLKFRQFTVEWLAGSRQVAAASGQVASANQSLAQGTSEQAATLEETAASTTEIAAITRQNADNTRTVAGLME